MVTSMDSVYEH